MKRKTTQLKEMLESPEALVMPGCYDALSARLIELAGFKAIQCSGFGFAASILCKPDIGLLTFPEMLAQTRNVVNAVSIPVMADGDTGFGNAINVTRTVKEFEAMGAAGINLEDQFFPKRCGHMEGKQIISKEEMLGKIRAAAEARTDPDFIINARTDAVAVSGVDEAIERGNAYAEAGADLIFGEAPTEMDEIKRMIREIHAPVSINLFDGVHGGKTPLVPIKELESWGVARISIPVGVTFAAVRGVKNYLEALAKSPDGLAAGRDDLVVSFDEFKELVGLPEIRKLENKYLPPTTIKAKYG